MTMINLCACVCLVAQLAGAEPETTTPADETRPTDAAAAESVPPEEAPAPLRHREDVVVTASRVEQDLRDVPVAVTLITREEVERSTAHSSDELVRGVTGFGMRQRSGRAISAGIRSVSFRGLGNGTVSRTLVLLDGVPINEPITGSVHWSRVPVDHIERVEVVKSGSSGVWGNLALGGVINFITTTPPKDRVRTIVTAEGGTLDTGSVQASMGGGRGPFTAMASGSYFTTEGYIGVREDQRGAVDWPISDRTGTFSGSMQYQSSPSVRLSAGGNLHRERYLNGSRIAVAYIDLGQLRLGGDVVTASGTQWQATTFASFSQLDAVQTGVSGDRRTEQPVNHQFDVPSTTLGAHLKRAQSVRTWWFLTAGADFQRTEAEANEYFGFTSGRFTGVRSVGGTQTFGGFYVQNLFHAGPDWTLVGSVRADRWEATEGRRREVEIATGAPLTDRSFPANALWTVSPTVGVVHRVTEHVTWRSSTYRGFRAPIVSELYRQTRASTGGVAESNPFLQPEYVAGVETGVDVTPSRGVRVRATWFLSYLQNPIVPVTVGAAGPTPAVIEPCGFVPAGGLCLQQQNLGRLRSTGLETEVDYRVSSRWSASASYTLNPTRVTDAPSDPELVGRRASHVPEHELVIGTGWHDPRLLHVDLQVRYCGVRYQDDLNALRLGDFVLADMRLSRRIAGGADAFVKIQNLFDKTYEITRNAAGIVGTGAPRMITAGVRATF